MNGLTTAIQGSTVREADSQREFAELVQEHQSMVFSIAVHYLSDRSAAEEVAQEVFLQLYRNLAKLSAPEHRTAWLRKVACHRSIDYARKRKLEPKTKLDEIAEPAGEVRADDPMLREKLRKLIHSLPEKARAVMILRYQEDLYPEEIAAAMDIPVRTVKSLLQRSVALLRDKLDGARRVDKI